MAEFLSDTIGDLDDRVRLVLGADEIVIAESWDVQEGILSQPCSWSIRLGWGDVARDILARYKKRDPFKLFVGGALQASGRIDAIGAQQPPGSGMTVTIRGRDALAPLQDAFVRETKKIPDISYRNLVLEALHAAKIDTGPGDSRLVSTNAANRNVKTGVQVQTVTIRTADEFIALPGSGTLSVGTVQKEIEAKLNETWHAFVRRYTDRAGLFLWATADGGFFLGSPSIQQGPTYRLVRRRGQPVQQGANVVGVDFEDDATHRHSEAIIYGRGGGRKHGRSKSKGGFIDSEMAALGYDQAIVYRDVQVQDGAEAAFFARRRLSEERRNGYRLEYTIAGHRLPRYGSAQERAVVTVDTVIDVQDEELGIAGTFYIETVRRQRAPQTTTTMRLMRTEDLLFGEPGQADL